MIDDFCEYMVKRKRGTNDIIRISLLVLAGLVLTYLLLSFVYTLVYYYAPYLTSLIFPLVVLVWYGVYRLIKKTNIEFEYALTGGELDVDHIENKTKRKRLLRSIHARSLQIMAPASGSEYTQAYKSLKTIDASSNSGLEKAYFAVFEKDGIQQCLLFEPNAKMLDMMHRFNPDKIHIQ